MSAPERDVARRPIREGVGARFLLALFAALPGALAAAMAMHQVPPDGWTPLAQRPPWTAWALVGFWPLLAVCIAAVTRRDSQVWKLGFGVAAGGLMLAAILGLVTGGASTGAITLSLLALALSSGALGMALGEPRPEKPPKPRSRPPSFKDKGMETGMENMASAASCAPDASADAHPDRSLRPSRRRMALLIACLAHLRRHAGFWMSAVLMVESFRLAHVVAVDPQRGVGMVGMLLTFFLVLPAVSLAAWFPRTALVLLTLAAAGFAGIGWLSGLVQAPVAAVLLAGLAATLWRRREPVREIEGDPIDVPEVVA